MTPQTAASQIVAILPDGTTEQQLAGLTDHQWVQLAERAGLRRSPSHPLVVGPECRANVAALLKARTVEADLDPFRGLPVT